MMRVIGTAAAVALVLAPGSEGAALLRGHRAVDTPATPGADCGQARHVIPKFSKAAKVGALAGSARAAASNANVAAEAAEVAAKKSVALGASEGTTGTNEAAQEVVTTAQDKATAASVALESGINTFKMKADSSEFAGADVQQSDMDTLQNLIDDANAKTKAVYVAIERMHTKMKEAKAKAEKATKAAVATLSQVVDEAKPTLKHEEELSQQAKWAVDDAKALVERSKTASGKVATAAGKAEEQAPVFEALKDDLDAQTTAVEDAHAAVTDAMAPAKTSSTDLSAAIEPLETDIQRAKGGKDISDSDPALVTTAEELQDKADAALLDLESKTSALTARMKGLKEKLGDVEKKVEA